MLLEKGYKVRGSVRSLSNDTKVKHLKESFPGLELVRVAATLSRHCPARCPRAVTHPHPGRAQVEADLLTPGSFDAGIDGCDYVMHTASPFQIAGITDPQKELVGGFFSFVFVVAGAFVFRVRQVRGRLPRFAVPRPCRQGHGKRPGRRRQGQSQARGADVVVCRCVRRKRAG